MANENKYDCVRRDSEREILQDVEDAVKHSRYNHDLRIAYWVCFGLSVVTSVFVAALGKATLDLFLLPIVLLFGFGYIGLLVVETYGVNHACILYNRYLFVATGAKRRRRKSVFKW